MMSANAHPIGTDHQIPVTPICGIADKIYARTTLVPRENMVSTTLIPGLPKARYKPYSKNSHPIHI